MDYEKVYDSLIKKRKKDVLKKVGDGSIETHHILPRSAGGTNDDENLVNLTCREHFMAHLLLFYDSKRKKDIKNMRRNGSSLFFMMSRSSKFNSHTYESLKKQAPSWMGKEHTNDSRNKIRKTMTPSNSSNPRVWVCKDGDVRYIIKETLEEFLSNGYELGRKGYKPRKNGQGKRLG